MTAGGVQLCSGCHRSTEPGSGLWVDRVEQLDAAGRLSWVCVDCMADDSAPGWVFVNLETGTVDGIGVDSWAVDSEALTDNERALLHDADEIGWHDLGAVDVVRARGVAMSEALDALAIVRRLDAAGLMCQVLDALAAEEDDGEDEEDDEWTDCNDDGGAVCNAAAGFPCSACAAARGVEA